MKRTLIVLAALAVVSPAAAQSQSTRFEVGIQVATPRSSQFDAVDLGFGGRFAWHLSRRVGVEAEINFYPGDFTGPRPFSRDRVEALFGGTIGFSSGRVRPFARVRSGFVTFHEAPQPFPCILIFPPPLTCRMASGARLPAIDVGGGVEITTTARTFVRLDAGDRVLRYPGPVFDQNRVMRDRPFISHEFRFAAGGGLRF